jgi:hypothetical protein
MVKFQCLGSEVSEMGGREGRDSETQDAQKLRISVTQKLRNSGTQEENGVDRQINFIHHSSTRTSPT